MPLKVNVPPDEVIEHVPALISSSLEIVIVPVETVNNWLAAVVTPLEKLTVPVTVNEPLDSDAAIQDEYARRASLDTRGRAGIGDAADVRQSRHRNPRRHGSGRESLQRAAGIRCLCQRGSP